MDNITYEKLQEVIAKLTLQNKQLRRANSRLKAENRNKTRSIRKYKEQIKLLEGKKNKQHYKNGRRGTKFNG